MSDRSANGRRAVVTGAASGIGRATAIRLSKDGYRLHLVDRDAAGLIEVTAECGGEASAHAVDLSRPAETVPALRADLGDEPIDLLVNCAGVGWAATTAQTDEKMWATTIDVNLTATFYMCQLALPGMLEQGRGVIVNMASAGALVGLKNRVAYCASKAGILGLTRAIAADHASAGIRINAVCPGTVDSPWIGKILSNAEDPEGTRKLMEQRQLDGRMGTPEEVAEWVAFVAGDSGRFMNGASLVIDGGLTAV